MTEKKARKNPPVSFLNLINSVNPFEWIIYKKNQNMKRGISSLKFWNHFEDLSYISIEICHGRAHISVVVSSTLDNLLKIVPKISDAITVMLVHNDQFDFLQKKQHFWTFI